ncbi:MAG TPA: HAMP domain-containing sensor histidine kinase, partial [bacterium]|nr:HAMP domain-containing sensor histidine kinase [bacterium]
EELIGFVTLEEEALSMAKENVDLREMIDSISSECGSRMTSKHPRITFEASPGAEGLEFNRDYLRLILCELIQNAVKFNAGDSPEVTIRSARDEGGFSLAVSDNGMGIPPELHAKIFEKFYQAERYFTGNVEGVGLGLSFVKRIVDFAGGTIEVRSEPGKGSTFTIRLPSQ